MRYIERHPGRAGLVARPEDDRWSSDAANALGEANCIVSPHDAYVHLGQTLPQRRAASRALCAAELTAEALGRIRNCTPSGTPMGSERFKAQRENTLRRKVGGETRGRPPGLGIDGDVRLKQDDTSARTAASARDALAHDPAGE
jgi:REP-associated tyrosine transposase